MCNNCKVFKTLHFTSAGSSRVQTSTKNTIQVNTTSASHKSGLLTKGKEPNCVSSMQRKSCPIARGLVDFPIAIVEFMS